MFSPMRCGWAKCFPGEKTAAEAAESSAVNRTSLLPRTYGAVIAKAVDGNPQPVEFRRLGETEVGSGVMRGYQVLKVKGGPLRISQGIKLSTLFSGGSFRTPNLRNKARNFQEHVNVALLKPSALFVNPWLQNRTPRRHDRCGRQTVEQIWERTASGSPHT